MPLLFDKLTNWILLTVSASPIPRLFGCIASANDPAYLASVFVILMFYDGGKSSNFGQKKVQ